MVGRAANKESVMMITSDSDMVILAGDDSCALKSFTRDGTLEIVSTSEATIKKLMSYLSSDAEQRILFVPAKHPVFEGIEDRKLRALMCLFLGCDVYGGMKGVGPKSLEDIIKNKYDKYKNRSPENEYVSLYSYLKKYLYSKTNGMNHEIVQTYIQAMTCEPTNPVPTDEEKENGKSYRTYVNGAEPSTVPKYLEEFAAEQTTIKEGPAIALCIGVDECGHKFLEADGYHICKQCEGVVCNYCNETIGTQTYCLLCYAENSIVSIPGENNNRSKKPVIEMRDELATHYNFDSIDDLTHEEVEDFYEVRDIITARTDEIADAVPFPLYATNELDGDNHWSDLMDIELADGGSFINNPDLESKHLPGILQFFGSLVRFVSTKRTDHVKDSPIYSAMPEILIVFAEKCRVDSGFRLLARTVRHSFDSRIPGMEECLTKLVVDESGEIGIHIQSKIPASMRKNTYDTDVVATTNNLLCCKCSCQCGSKGDERIACVHTLVRLYMLSLLLHEHLAENILCELAARLVDSIDSNGSSIDDEQWLWDMGRWTEAEVEIIKSNVVLLMEASGETVRDNDLDHSLPELLQSFSVGTQKRKEWVQSTKIAPKPSELGPIAEMKFMSTAFQAKASMRRDAKFLNRKNSTAFTLTECLDDDANDDANDDCDSEEESNQEIPNEETKEPQFRKIWSLMDAVGIQQEDSKFVGMRILYMRAEAQDKQLTLSQKRAMDSQSKKDWSSLYSHSEKRSLNSTESQRRNLKRKQNADSSVPSTPQPNKKLRVVTPSPDHCVSGRTRLRRNQQVLPIKMKPKPRKRPEYLKCHMPGCPVNNSKESFKHIKYHCVPCYPKDLKSRTPRHEALSNRHAKMFHRREMLRRMLIDPNSRATYRVCEMHQFEEKSHSISVNDNNGKSWTRSYKLTLPMDFGPKSNQHEPKDSSGMGADRQLARLLKPVMDTIQEGNKMIKSRGVSPCCDSETVGVRQRDARPTTISSELRKMIAERDRYKNESIKSKADAAEALLALNQTFEQNCSDQHVRINPTVKNLASLDKHLPDTASATPNGEGRFFKAERSQPKVQTPRKKLAHDPPVLDLNIADSEVKRRTGFESLHTMLVYIFIVCNGDVAVVTKRNTSLTWFEEWFLHFEYKWGRTLSRLWDATKIYGPARRIIIKLIREKYDIESRSRSRWPVYVTHEEDIAIRKPKWNDKYPRSQRIVMWDMTNIEAYGFSDANLQRLTYSKYYNQNCFKGGVFVQLCGWLGVAELAYALKSLPQLV